MVRQTFARFREKCIFMSFTYRNRANRLNIVRFKKKLDKARSRFVQTYFVAIFDLHAESLRHREFYIKKWNNKLKEVFWLKKNSEKDKS